MHKNLSITHMSSATEATNQQHVGYNPKTTSVQRHPGSQHLF